jgi:hypothetical protein
VNSSLYWEGAFSIRTKLQHRKSSVKGSNIIDLIIDVPGQRAPGYRQAGLGVTKFGHGHDAREIQGHHEKPLPTLFLDL